MVDETTGMEMFSDEAKASVELRSFDEMWGKIERRQDIGKFFLVIFSAIIAITYGVGMFYFGRATEPKPDPQIYVVNESTTTAP